MAVIRSVRRPGMPAQRLRAPVVPGAESKTPAGSSPPPASLLYQLSYGKAEAIPAGLEPATARLIAWDRGPRQSPTENPRPLTAPGVHW